MFSLIAVVRRRPGGTHKRKKKKANVFGDTVPSAKSTFRIGQRSSLNTLIESPYSTLYLLAIVKVGQICHHCSLGPKMSDLDNNS